MNLVDPDVAVCWNSVIQVIVSTKESSCPICLQLPSVPRITKCGHIYCFKCILHYLALGEKKWRACPICDDYVYKNELRPVRLQLVEPVQVNDCVTFTLMQRPKMSAIALPRKFWKHEASTRLLSYDEDGAATFAKMMWVSKSELDKNFDDEIKVLLTELQSALCSSSLDESDFIPDLQTALAEVENQRASMDSMISSCHTSIFGGSPSPSPTNKTHFLTDSKMSKAHRQALGSDVECESPGSSPSAAVPDQQDTLSIGPSIPDIADESRKLNHGRQDESYFFYQSQNGQLLFLHPVDIKILLKQYGSFENFPDTLSGRVIELDYYAQTENFRKRNKYLAHLPLSCEFSFGEIDMTGCTVVAPSVLALFTEELRAREKRRLRDSAVAAPKGSLYEDLKRQQKFADEVDDFGANFSPTLPSPDFVSDFPVVLGSSPPRLMSRISPEGSTGSYANALRGIMSNVSVNPPLRHKNDFPMAVSESLAFSQGNHTPPPVAPSASAFIPSPAEPAQQVPSAEKKSKKKIVLYTSGVFHS